MLTTSRREVSVDDEYSYKKNASAFQNGERVAVREKPTNITSDKYSTQPNYFTQARPKTSDEESEYSLEAIKAKLFGGSVATEEDQVDTADFSNPNLMPSSMTMGLSPTYRTKEQTSVATQTKVATKLSTKSKIYIASYVAVVLALVIIVAISAVAVSTAFANIATINGDYVAQSAELKEFQEQLVNVDTATLLKKAEELGFTEANNSNTKRYDILSTRPAQNSVAESNWFNDLCNWVSDLLGA